MQGLNINFDPTNFNPNSFETTSLKSSQTSVSFLDILNKELSSAKDTGSVKNESGNNTHTEVSKADSVNHEDKVAKSSTDSEKDSLNVKSKELKKEKDYDKEKTSSKKEDDNDSKTQKSVKELADVNVFQKFFAVRNSKDTDIYLSENKSLQDKVLHTDKLENKLRNPQAAILSFSADSKKSAVNSGFDIELNKIAGFSVKDKTAKNAFEITDKTENKISKSDKKQKTFKDVFSVTDLRTKKDTAAVKKTNSSVTINQTGKNSVEMSISLDQQAQKNILSLDNQSASANGSNFQAMLENQIKSSAGDFVKASNIVLKDNNNGKINLILNPRNLGNVKISLDLSDKNITGKIIVSSTEAYSAFNSSQNDLRQAFLENGFDSVNFEVAMAENYAQGDSSTGSGNFDQNRQNERRAAQYYENIYAENVTDFNSVADTLNTNGKYSLNVVA